MVADSHFHPPGIPEQAAWEADRHFNDRNRAVVRWVEAADVAFTVHLGDVPHPVPGLEAHEQAMATAREVYDALSRPIHVVAGNHDIGDKPKPLSPVPPTREDLLARFEGRWGPLWKVVEERGWGFVLVNTPLMNTGSEREAAQWAWLEGVLGEGNPRRTVVGLHYPPFLLHPDEPEHYDNLAEPARSRLLGLLDGVRAVFCGHVHHFFWHPVGGTDLYIAPSTAFVRPGYSELARVGPGPAFGRDDTDKLGGFVLHLEEDGDGFEVEHVRTHHLATVPELAPGAAPARPGALGVTLRHAWDEVHVLPADGLEPFQRKQARDDMALWSLWEAGVRWLRVPVADLLSPSTRARMEALVVRGFRFVAFGTGPAPADLGPAHAYEAIGTTAGSARVWAAPVSRAAVHDGERFSHFPSLGFDADVPPHGVVRCGADTLPADAPAGGVALLVEIPRAGESSRQQDHDGLALRVAEAWVVAEVEARGGGRRVFLDGYMDHDRGYFPRDGLIDRRGGPREAPRVLVHLARLPGAAELGLPVARDGSRVCEGPEGALWLGGDMPAGIDLVDGAWREAGRSRRPRWVR